MRPRAILTTAAAAAVLAVVPAVAQAPQEVPDPSITDGSAQKALDAAKAKWRARGPRSYTMRVAHTCFCPLQYTRPHTVVVRNGRIVKAGTEARPHATVPRLFRIVQEAIDGKVVRLEARYDTKRGFPRLISVDVSMRIADEEQAYQVDRFSRLTRR
jgi:hypothetical protein